MAKLKLKLKTKWNDRYLEQDTPWDIGIPHAELQRLFSYYVPEKDRVLDIGCGLGTNSQWLAESGYTVTGIDFSEAAITEAKLNAKKNGLAIDFQELDFLRQWRTLPQFPILFDCAVFHTFSNSFDRKRFVRAADKICQHHGIWISIACSKDRAKEISVKANCKPPPIITLKQIVEVVEPRFEVLETKRCNFTIKRSNHTMINFNGWACVFKKRK